MNKAYRLIWNKAKECWIVAAETITGNGGPPPITVAAAAVISAVLALTATGAHALPTGGQVAAGQAAISTPSATQMNISQGTNQAIINWNSFGIGKGEAVNIAQPSSQSTLLNRVLGNIPSQIFGSLNANGRVFLVNPGGVLFAPGASVNVGGLVASSLNIKDSDFLAGKYSFFKDGSSGAVVNQGNISDGFVALLGNSVENAGTIVTTKGTTGLAAGDEITLGFDPNGLMAIKIDKATYQAQVTNSGIIEADGGTVVMTAAAADALLATVVNNSGTVHAKSMVERNGEIVIEGGAIFHSGSIDVSGSTGGVVALNAGQVVLIDGTIHADGNSGGQVSITAPRIGQSTAITAAGSSARGGNISFVAEQIVQSTGAQLNVSSTKNIGGQIDLRAVAADGSGHLFSSGAFDATGQHGGKILLTGTTVDLYAASLDASGINGGGQVLIGGDYQGSNASSAVFSDANTGFIKSVTGSGFTVFGSESDNYSLTNTNVNSTADITRRPLTVTADAKEKNLGQADSALTYQAEAASTGRGLLPGESVSGSLTRINGEGVGAYPIQQGSVESPNYSIAFVAADLTKRVPPHQ